MFVVKKANIQFVLKIKIRHQVIFSPSLMCCILKTIVSVLQKRPWRRDYSPLMCLLTSLTSLSLSVSASLFSPAGSSRSQHSLFIRKFSGFIYYSGNLASQRH